MKNCAAFVIFCLLASIISAADATEYSPGIKYAIEQLRNEKTDDGTPAMIGIIMGIPGSRGTFYLLYPYLTQRATINDYKLMLKDPSPLVRLLAAKRIMQAHLRPLPENSIDFLSNDKTEVRAGPIYDDNGNAQFKNMTVSAIIDEMKKDPEFLFKPYYGDFVSLAYITESQPLKTLKPITQIMPGFPQEMARARIPGEVILRFIVQPDGSISDISVIKQSHSEFVFSAKDALSKWKFESTAQNKREFQMPQALECRFVFDFKDE